MTAAERAHRDGKDLILIMDHPGLPEKIKRDALREELDHTLQAQLNGSPSTHLTNYGDFIITDLLGLKAMQYLQNEHGYAGVPESTMAAEVGVRLMRPGGYVELGLNVREAGILAHRYVQLLREEHGDANISEIVEWIDDAQRRNRGEESHVVSPPATRAAVPEELRLGVQSAGESGNLFSAQAERQSRLDDQRAKDKLLGDQLTAQVKSGGAVKPPKLKPARSRPLFDEPEAEQRSLFDAYKLKGP